MRKTLLVSAALSLMLLSAGRVVAQSTSRATLLQGSRNVVVSTTGGQRHYYIVNSEQTYNVLRKEGKIVIDRDTFPTADIASIRFQTIPRFAIDEDSTALGENYAVTQGLLAFRRSMNVGQWNSLTLPFSLTVAQVHDAFGSDAQVAAVSRIVEGDVLTIEFATVSLSDDRAVLIEEGKPYIIRPTRQPDIAEDGTTTMVYGSGRVDGPVYLIPGVTVEKGKKYFTPLPMFSDSRLSAIRIRGSYTATSAKPSRYPVYMLSDEGLFAPIEEETPVKGFRTWTEIVKNPNEAPVRFYVDGIDEDLTLPLAISDVSLTTTAGSPLYDLQGRRITTRPRSGIYIIDGKKKVFR